MNTLTVEYDEEGNRHYFRDGEEISEKAYLTQHPGMPTPKGNTDGRDGSTDSASGFGTGESSVSAEQSAAEEVRKGIRRVREESRQGQRAGNASDAVGQRETR